MFLMCTPLSDSTLLTWILSMHSGSFRVKSTNFWQISSSTISDFDKIFTECELMYFNMLCKILQQYSQYSLLGGILKTYGVAPFIAICKSRLNLLPYFCKS